MSDIIGLVAVLPHPNQTFFEGSKTAFSTLTFAPFMAGFGRGLAHCLESVIESDFHLAAPFSPLPLPELAGFLSRIFLLPCFSSISLIMLADAEEPWKGPGPNVPLLTLIPTP